MGRLFGTDGVRGIANEELTPELALRLGQTGALVLTEELCHKPTILVGKDPRSSSDLLEAALCAGLCSVGARVIVLGMLPTPAVAYLTKLYKADAGVMISASHNPMEYNGIKFFNKHGFKLSDETENKIEEIIHDENYKMPRPTGCDISKIEICKEAASKYSSFIKSLAKCDLNGLKIGLDCANGAASEIAGKIFKDLGAEVYVINNIPNGGNINQNCGSTDVRALQSYVRENNLHMGLAFDGDADRVIAVDENSEIVDGDKIMSICGMDMKSKGKLKSNTIVATVMSNLGLFIMGRENNINILQTAVGDRYVLEKMIEGGYSLGGEQSGHIIFLEHNTTGDGLITGINLASILAERGTSLSQLAKVMKCMPQVLVNVKANNEKKYMYSSCPEIADSISKIEEEFSGKGRVLIRPSGTEPLIRVMIEGDDINYISEKAYFLASVIEKCLS